MSDKLRPGDYRFIVICVLVCAGSLFVGVRYFYRAFPEASIQFNYNRDTSRTVAEAFLATQHLTTQNYRHAAAFDYDNEAKVFMERELGLEKANKSIGDGLKLWRWGHRWFQPLQREEISVEVTPRGEIASFNHIIPEEAAGAHLPAEEARATAESFLLLDMRRPIESLEFVDSESRRRPNRTDHTFTWKIAGLDLPGASYRVTVTVQGDRIDGYNEYLKVPEQWSRNYARLRSLNESAAQIALLLFALLGLAMLITLARRVRINDVRWKTALAFASVCCVLQFLSSVNEFPLAIYDFDTTSSWAGFVTQSMLVAAFGALSFGGIIFLLTACVEPVYRQAYPAHLSIRRMFSWKAIRTLSFFRASLAGVTLTFFLFAYQIAFYLAANKLGAWSPAEIPYTDLLSTRLPWVFVLLGGFFPAVSEEWMFRGFAVPYLQGLLRHRWIAVVLASFIWGFGHANYPNEPFFVRGLEVGLVGLILSWAMIRFGILSALIAHYSIDAFFSAFLLLRSGNPYLTLSGAVTAGINLIPLLVAAGAYVATRRFHSDATLTNAAEGTASPRAAAQRVSGSVPRYTPLSAVRVYAALGLLAVGAAAAFFHAPRFGDFLRFRVSAVQARRAASQFLTDLGFDVQRYRSAAQVADRTDPLEVQYIYSAGGIERLNRLYRDYAPPAVWEVRFYRPLQNEEFLVAVAPGEGSAIGFRRVLPEDAPGADLPEDQARQTVVSFLKGRGWDLSEYELKETRSEKPKRRRDTELTFEARQGTGGAVGQARARLHAAVLGDKIGSWTHSIKIPEEWRRLRERRTLYVIAVSAVRTLFIVVLFSVAILQLVQATRQGIVRWSIALRVGAAAMCLELMNVLNSIPDFRFQYVTQVAPEIFVLTSVIGSLVLLIGIGLAAALAAALVIACFPAAQAMLRRRNGRLWGRDAAFAAGATLGCFMVLQWAAGRVQYHFSKLALAPTLFLPESIGTYLPLLSNIRNILLSALFFSTVLAFAVHLWTRLAGRTWLRALLIAGLWASFLPLSAARVSEAALDAALSALLIAFAGVLVAVFFRNNYLAYLLSAAVWSGARTSSSLLDQGNIMLAIQGWVLWGVALALLTLLVVRSSAPIEDSPLTIEE
jgi:membrane protease YdiL (CAAX protease family)